MLSLCSCQINAPQLDRFTTTVQQLVSDSSNRDIYKYLWTARIGSEGRLMTAQASDGFIVFTSEEGDAVAFDGWQIRSLIGFSDYGPRQIVVALPKLHFRTNKRSTYTSCEHWSADENQRSITIYKQACGRSGENQITKDDEGTIREIRHIIDETGTMITLTKLMAPD